jgi:hypothetical protein
MKSPDTLLPLRRDKTSAKADFWHTLRWGFVLSFVVLIAVSLAAH